MVHDRVHPIFVFLTIFIVFLDCSDETLVAPVAIGDSYQGYVLEEISGNILENDLEDDGAVLAIIQDVVNGTLALDPTSGDFFYVPNVEFIGIDSFRYQLCHPENLGLCNFATVTLTVSDYDFQIVTKKDTFKTTEGEPIVMEVLINDVLPVSYYLNLVTNVPKESGSLKINENSTFKFFPADGFLGQTTFTYSICDMDHPNNCDEGHVTIIVNERGLRLGDFYEGGVIFYLDGTRKHGLVCTIYSYLKPWGCYCSDIPGANGFEIGTGAQNTEAIVAGCDEPDIAAKFCLDLHLNGYSDWYLPSMGELEQMGSAVAPIDSTSVANGGHAISDENSSYNLYWSSTNDNNCAAWLFSFGGRSRSDGKFVAYKFRAIRNF